MSEKMHQLPLFVKSYTKYFGYRTDYFNQDTLPSSSYVSALGSFLSKSEQASEIDDSSAQQNSEGYW
jgi:hypothetical protein